MSVLTITLPWLLKGFGRLYARKIHIGCYLRALMIVLVIGGMHSLFVLFDGSTKTKGEGQTNIETSMFA